MLKNSEKFYDAFVNELEKSDEDFERDYRTISESLKEPETDIPLHEWIIFTIHASNSVESAMKTIHDAYKLGFMAGRGEWNE